MKIIPKIISLISTQTPVKTAKSIDALCREAVQDFKGNSHSVNNFLRGINDKFSFHPPEKVKEMIHYMDILMQKSILQKDKVLYRFCDDPALNSNIKTYSDKGFMSTCKRMSKVYRMLDSWGYKPKILKIHVPKGTNAIDVEKFYNRYDTEAEVILPRGMSYDVKRVFSTEEAFPYARRFTYDDDNRVYEMVIRQSK